VSDEEFAAISAADPTLIRYVYPAGAYRGIEETASVGTPNLLIVSEEMDEELAYQFTKNLFEHIRIVRAIHPSANETVPEAALASPVPLHLGAIRALEELGLTVPDRLKVD
jgi:TRAP-type uncharacterized transport system substrate-binding protein